MRKTAQAAKFDSSHLQRTVPYLMIFTAGYTRAVTCVFVCSACYHFWSVELMRWERWNFRSFKA